MSEMATLALESTAPLRVGSGRGVLAVDARLPTLGKRFAALDASSTEENRRAYRKLLFTPPGLGEFVGGASLFAGRRQP